MATTSSKLQRLTRWLLLVALISSLVIDCVVNAQSGNNDRCDTSKVASNVEKSICELTKFPFQQFVCQNTPVVSIVQFFVVQFKRARCR